MKYILSILGLLFLFHVLNAQDETFTYKDIRVQWNKQRIAISNTYITRVWKIENGLLLSTSLRDSRAKEYVSGEANQQAPYPDFKVSEQVSTVAFAIDTGRSVSVEETSVLVKMISTFPSYKLTTYLKIFPNTPAMSSWLESQEFLLQKRETLGFLKTVASGGNEMAANSVNLSLDLNDFLRLSNVHTRLGTVALMDHTDTKDNLVQTESYLLTIPSFYTWRGNLFYTEDQFTKSGLIFLKEAPLPHARPVKSDFDLVNNGQVFAFTGLGSGEDSIRTSYPLTVLTYEGGETGRIKALQIYQRRRRVYNAKRDEVIWHSIWGDRNRDGRMNEKFLSNEIDQNEKLGIDHLYFIDGWQNGISSNSIDAAKGGVWENQWSIPDYWKPNLKRFPSGFENLVEKATSKNFKIGFWYNPDRTDDYKNWERDAAVVLGLHRDYNASNVKFDGINFNTKRGEANILKLMHHVVDQTKGKTSIEIDITAGVRPGYFCGIPYGYLFLENRYSDWRKYYPHTTLRNLWQLSQYVDPTRLRIEFLNNERNKHLYENDVLAPYHYSSDYLFATAMFAMPMAWLETSGLTDDYKAKLGNIIGIYKRHRDAIHQGLIFPIGKEPDGQSWTGFISQHERQGYIVVFREKNEYSTQEMDVRLSPGAKISLKLLAGKAKDFKTTVSKDGTISFSLPDSFSFAFYQYEIR